MTVLTKERWDSLNYFEKDNCNDLIFVKIPLSSVIHSKYDFNFNLDDSGHIQKISILKLNIDDPLYDNNYQSNLKTIGFQDLKSNALSSNSLIIEPLKMAPSEGLSMANQRVNIPKEVDFELKQKYSKVALLTKELFINSEMLEFEKDALNTEEGQMYLRNYMNTMIDTYKLFSTPELESMDNNLFMEHVKLNSNFLEILNKQKYDFSVKMNELELNLYEDEYSKETDPIKKMNLSKSIEEKKLNRDFFKYQSEIQSELTDISILNDLDTLNKVLKDSVSEMELQLKKGEILDGMSLNTLEKLNKVVQSHPDNRINNLDSALFLSNLNYLSSPENIGQAKLIFNENEINGLLENSRSIKSSIEYQKEECLLKITDNLLKYKEKHLGINHLESLDYLKEDIKELQSDIILYDKKLRFLDEMKGSQKLEIPDELFKVFENHFKPDKNVDIYNLSMDQGLFLMKELQTQKEYEKTSIDLQEKQILNSKNAIKQEGVEDSFKQVEKEKIETSKELIVKSCSMLNTYNEREQCLQYIFDYNCQGLKEKACSNFKNLELLDAGDLNKELLDKLHNYYNNELRIDNLKEYKENGNKDNIRMDCLKKLDTLGIMDDMVHNQTFKDNIKIISFMNDVDYLSKMNILLKENIDVKLPLDDSLKNTLVEIKEQVFVNVVDTLNMKEELNNFEKQKLETGLKMIELIDKMEDRYIDDYNSPIFNFKESKNIVEFENLMYRHDISFESKSIIINGTDFIDNEIISVLGELKSNSQDTSRNSLFIQELENLNSEELQSLRLNMYTSNDSRTSDLEKYLELSRIREEIVGDIDFNIKDREDIFAEIKGIQENINEYFDSKDINKIYGLDLDGLNEYSKELNNLGDRRSDIIDSYIECIQEYNYDYYPKELREKLSEIEESTQTEIVEKMEEKKTMIEDLEKEMLNLSQQKERVDNILNTYNEIEETLNQKIEKYTDFSNRTEEEKEYQSEMLGKLQILYDENEKNKEEDTLLKRESKFYQIISDAVEFKEKAIESVSNTINQLHEFLNSLDDIYKIDKSKSEIECQPFGANLTEEELERLANMPYPEPDEIDLE